jgi:signal transduction histidine kinase/tetratricopeptide (TPR) repeat protein
MNLRGFVKYGLILLLFLMTQASYAQSISAKKINKELAKAEGLIEQKKFDQAKEIIDRALESSISDKNYYGIANSHYLLGNIYRSQGDLSNAYREYWKSFGSGRITEDSRLQLKVVYQLGNLFYSMEFYDRALEYFEIGDSLLYYAHVPKYLVDLNERLATSYFKLKRYTKAKTYFYELMKYSIQYQNTEREVEARNGIAVCYAELLDYSSAIQFKLSLISIYKNQKDIKSISRTYYEIANYYRLNNEEHKANDFYYLVLHSEGLNDSLHVETLLYQVRSDIYNNKDYDILSRLNKTIRIAEKADMQNEVVEAMNLITLYYYQKQEDKLAEDQIEKTVQQFTDRVDPEVKMMVYNLAIKVYQRNKDYKASFQFMQQYLNQVQIVDERRTEAEKKMRLLERELEKQERDLQQSIFNDQFKLIDNELMKHQYMALKSNADAQRARIALLESEHKRRILKKEHEKQMVQQELKNRELEKEVEHAKVLEFEAMDVLQNDSIQRLKYEKKILAEKQKTETLKRERNNLLKFTFIAIGFFIILIIFYISVHRANKKLEIKNKIIALEKQHTDEALEKLKQTQSQLIESERLASLGELTAGIAHEIRNPLNFVNNFSELNLDLTQELKEELQKHINDKDLVEDLMELAAMISDNSRKINEHGARAARIVKQMLDSSRKGDIVFESTDINLLVEESTKLAYQGVRGKEVDFTVDLRFDFDKQIGKQNIVSQELGRVLINLVTNACHAMLAKMKVDADYSPVLTVSTKDKGDNMEIVVADNGIGISEEVKAKIFDPFFTTKPTGVGTGLGLTMSFDIVNNMHKGSIDVDTKLGEYTRFILNIPKKLA